MAPSEKGKHKVEYYYIVEDPDVHYEEYQDAKEALDLPDGSSPEEIEASLEEDNGSDDYVSSTLDQIPTTIRARLLDMDIYIHPYLYELFRHAMYFWPEGYPEDNDQYFSRFLLQMGLWFRKSTDQLLAWQDAWDQDINSFMVPSMQGMGEGGNSTDGRKETESDEEN